MPDGSVDVVLCAQAWHWVDPQRAVPEVARVLSPGGRLGLIWNKRDERVDWVKQLGVIMHGNDDRAETPVVGPPFALPERRDFEWTHLTTPTRSSTWWRRAATSSPSPRMPAARCSRR